MSEPDLLTAPPAGDPPVGAIPSPVGDPPAAPPAGDPPPADPPAEIVYEFKAPEGVELDANMLGAFSEAAKELKLPQEAAQALIDKMVPAMEANNVAMLDTMRGAWKQQTIADVDLGGPKLAETIATAKRGLEFAGTPALKKLLDDSGLGNHPEVIRAFHKVGAAIGQDGNLVNGSPPQPQKSLAERLYGKGK